MLRFPGARPRLDSGVSRREALGQISNFRDNWWCMPDELNDQHYSTANLGENKPLRLLYPGGKAGAPEFLSAEEKLQASSELKQLRDAGTAPNFLTLQTLAWAQQNPDDPRVPEALHLAVRSTRFGCTDKHTSPLSKQAFRLLHSRYPQSPWAAKTKYWF